ncbi:MAG TPA: sensor histidine kinase [Solirubrobacteraceae bacterium]
MKIGRGRWRLWDKSRKVAAEDPSVLRAVSVFALTGLAAVCFLSLLAVALLRDTANSEATHDAASLTQLAGIGIVGPALSGAVIRGEPAALARLDQIVRSRVMFGPVVRVKIWDASGRIVYSDEPRLIGERYALPAEALKRLKTGGTSSEISNLSRPENRFERTDGKLLEVYEGIVAPTGQRLLFEAYQRYSAISSQSKRLWSAFLPALIGAMVLLELLQMPLAISLARRLKRGALEREQLMRRAIDASSRERRRIARDLHDGPVQGLAGVSYSLAAAGGRIGSLDSAAGKLVDTAGVDTRRAITQLRSLLVELYPPTLSSEGLRAAVSDLAAPLSARNIKVEIDVPEDLDVDEDVEAVLFRSAQEALRNIAAHAHASAVQLGVRSEAGYVVLAISDDGRGFDMHVQSPEGHLGLTLVADLVSEAGGELSVDSHPGGGTSVTVVIPS